MKVILWDWDNTLADTIVPLLNAFNATFDHYQMPSITREQMKIFMNSAGNQLFKDLFLNQDLNEVRQIYLKNYMNNFEKLALMPGAKEILKWAKENGFTNLAASNKDHELLKKEIQIAGLAEYFLGIFGAEKFLENKPSKVFTDAVLANYPNREFLFSVGDGVSDIKMAHNYPNGKAILVGTDPKLREFENNQPDFWVKNLSEVKEVLLQQLS